MDAHFVGGRRNAAWRSAAATVLGLATFGWMVVGGAVSSAASTSTGCTQSGAYVTCVFDAVDAQQTFVVPAGVSSVHVLAVGAPGAVGSYQPGQPPGMPVTTAGRGASVGADLAVVPGSSLFVEVGGAPRAVVACPAPAPNPCVGGFNGGGSGGGGGGGGGASDVRTISRVQAGSLASRVLVAGGGGGGADEMSCHRGRQLLSGSGGDAGAPGAPGAVCPEVTATVTGGGAGTQVGGGAGGQSNYFGPARGTDGALGVGGDAPAADVAAGGGGGYYGGGSGVVDSGGGGGSSLVPVGGSSSLTGSSPTVTVSYVVASTGTPCPAAGSSSLGSSLPSGGRLLPGQELTSRNGCYALVMQGDGNLVEYLGSRPLFATGTFGNPGATALMQTDGNLVVYSADGRALFATNTYGHAGGALLVRDDGHAVVQAGLSVVYDNRATGAVLRGGSSLRANQELLSANGRYSLVMQGDGNLVERMGTKPVFASNTYGHPGAVAIMQTDGNLVVYGGSKPLFATNTYGHPGALAVVLDNGNLVIADDARIIYTNRA